MGAGLRVATALLVAIAATAAGCSSPPPALPRSVLAKGADALPEKHPELTDQLKADCEQCHKASN